jgi:hypothetical protein
MCETLILATLLGFCGGIISGLFTKLIKPKQITTKKFTITYLGGKHSDWIIVKDKFGKEILSFSNKNDKLGIDYIRYAKY